MVCASFISTYSLKLNVILLPVTLVLLSVGEAFKSRGGMLSLGPPVGEPTWAQPALPTARMYKHETIKMVNSIWADLIKYN